MALREELARRGGWVHRTDLLESGWSAHRILAARRAEGIDLLRRRWLVLPVIAPAVREAARIGGVVSCVSALEPLGLWVPHGAPERAHLAVPAHTGSTSQTALCHRAIPIVPRNPRSLVDEVENVLAGVASCLAEEDAFCVWESATNQRLVTPEQLRRIRWRSRVAQRLARSVTHLSDSGIESMFVWRCRRAGIRTVQQVWLEGRPVDALIGARLVVQLDGWAYHSDPAQRRADIRHDRALVARGYTVLRFDYRDVVHDWPRVLGELRRAIAIAA